MLAALRAALSALTDHEHQCHERWKAALTEFELAKSEEYRARCAMQDAEDLRIKLSEFIAALAPEGQS